MTRKKQTPWLLIGLSIAAICLTSLYFIRSRKPSMMESMQEPTTGLDSAPEKATSETCAPEKPEEAVYELTDPCCIDYVKNCETPCVIKFYAPWCGACNHLASYYEEVAKEFKGQVTFYSLNVDAPEVMKKAEEEHLGKGSITALPTIVFLQKGKVHEQEIGALPKEKLVEKVKTYFAL